MILGIGETVEEVLENAEQWLDHPPCLAEDGTPLTSRAIHDYTRADSPHGEVHGDLYIRRCTPALAALVQQYGPTPFILRQDGVLDEA
jgi:hypothetical protein